jgi:hypothetical protein
MASLGAAWLARGTSPSLLDAVLLLLLTMVVTTLMHDMYLGRSPDT